MANRAIHISFFFFFYSSSYIVIYGMYIRSFCAKNEVNADAGAVAVSASYLVSFEMYEVFLWAGSK